MTWKVGLYVEINVRLKPFKFVLLTHQDVIKI